MNILNKYKYAGRNVESIFIDSTILEYALSISLLSIKISDCEINSINFLYFYLQLEQCNFVKIIGLQLKLEKENVK